MSPSPRSTSFGLHRHFTYANVMSTLAVLLLVIGGGTAVASNVAKTAAKNTVTSKSIKNNTISSKDLKNGAAVASADVINGSLNGADVKDDSLNGADVKDDSLSGADIDESTLTISPRGPAGGGLTGTYPNPDLAGNSVGSANVTDNSLAEGDLGAGSVTSSELGPIVRFESSITVAPTSNGTGITTCPAGQIALSGGARSGNLKIFAMSKENVTEAWVVQARNESGASATLTTFVYCLAA